MPQMGTCSGLWCSRQSLVVRKKKKKKKAVCKCVCAVCIMFCSPAEFHQLGLLELPGESLSKRRGNALGHNLEATWRLRMRARDWGQIWGRPRIGTIFRPKRFSIHCS